MGRSNYTYLRVCFSILLKLLQGVGVEMEPSASEVWWRSTRAWRRKEAWLFPGMRHACDDQYDQMARLFIWIFSLLQQQRNLPICIIFTKVGLKIFQIVNPASENCLRLFKCSQSVETLPKLVTLATTNSIQVHICQSYSGFRNLPMLSLLEIESFYLRQCAWKNKYVLPKW